MSERVIGVIQARMGSQRLPGKIVAPIAGRPLLALLLERLRWVPAGCPQVEAWWLATSNTRSDDVTAEWGQALGVNVFRGDEHDVLSRFIGVLDRDPADWVVRVTADDPFMDGTLIADLIAALAGLDPDRDLLCDAIPDHQFPLGYVPQLVSARGLRRADEHIPSDQPWHRAHVTSWVQAHGGHVAFAPDPELARPHWRWTVDTMDDLRMARAALELPALDVVRASYDELVELLDARPDITGMNAHITMKALERG